MRVQHFYLVNIQLGRCTQFSFSRKVCTKEVFSDYQLVTLKYLADYISLLFELVLQEDIYCTSLVVH